MFQIRDLTVVLKRKLGLEKNDAIILFAHNTVLKPDHILNDVYERHKDADGFLYLRYLKEDTFG